MTLLLLPSCKEKIPLVLNIDPKNKLESKIKDAVAINLERNDKIAVAVFNLENNNYECQINLDKKIEIASIAKLFIAVAVLEKFNGELDNDTKIELSKMLIDSNNNSADKLIDLLTEDYIDKNKSKAEIEKERIKSLNIILSKLGYDVEFRYKLKKVSGSNDNLATAKTITELLKKICLDSRYKIISEYLNNVSPKKRLFSKLKKGTYFHKTGTTDNVCNDVGVAQSRIIVTLIRTSDNIYLNEKALANIYRNLRDILFKQSS